MTLQSPVFITIACCCHLVMSWMRLNDYDYAYVEVYECFLSKGTSIPFWNLKILYGPENDYRDPSCSDTSSILEYIIYYCCTSCTLELRVRASAWQASQVYVILQECRPLFSAMEVYLVWKVGDTMRYNRFLKLRSNHFFKGSTALCCFKCPMAKKKPRNYLSSNFVMEKPQFSWRMNLIWQAYWNSQAVWHFADILRYTLLMCAAAHDIGHPGFSNELPAYIIDCSVCSRLIWTYWCEQNDNESLASWTQLKSEPTILLLIGQSFLWALSQQYLLLGFLAKESHHQPNCLSPGFWCRRSMSWPWDTMTLRP